MPVSTKTYWIKLGILSFLLALETYGLVFVIDQFVLTQNYFGIDWQFTLISMLLMLAILHTYALTMGAWNQFSHSIIPATGISLGIFAALFTHSLYYTSLITVFSWLILVYDGYQSYKTKNMLIKFDPRLIFSISAQGILLIVSLLAGVLVLFESAGITTVDISKKVTALVSQPVKTAVEAQLKNQFDTQMNNFGGTFGSDALQNILSTYGISTDNADSFVTTENLGINFDQIIQDQINKVLAPYQAFILPVIALIIFGLLQFMAFFVMILFKMTSGMVFSAAIATGLLHKSTITVQKEELNF